MSLVKEAHGSYFIIGRPLLSPFSRLYIDIHSVMTEKWCLHLPKQTVTAFASVITELLEKNGVCIYPRNFEVHYIS